MSWRHVPAPLLWAPRRRSGGSLAQKMWGAEFELWGPDCPLAPGTWKDRIGGLETQCVGSGDWFRDADGYVGVTKADVCYVTWTDALVDAILTTRRPPTAAAIHTLVFAVKGLATAAEATRQPLMCFRAGTTTYYFRAYRTTGTNPGTRSVSSFVGGSESSSVAYGSPRDIAADTTPTIVALELSGTGDSSRVRSVNVNGLDWYQTATGNSSRVTSSGRRLLAIDPQPASGWIAADAARSTAFLSCAWAPRKVDFALIRDWARAIGVSAP